MTMKIAHIVGARPQFIKMAMVHKAWQKAGQQFILHTGQHYDANMSQKFFDDLGIPQADVNLGIGGGSHAKQTAEMLIGIEKILIDLTADMVVIYGDTNTTLAGALVAAKDHFPFAHVEAGLRSFNKKMPEEINRVVADHLATLLFCPTPLSVENLKKEGINANVHLVGDVMADALMHYSKIASKDSNVLNENKLSEKEYSLLTLHRAGNVDDKEKMTPILSALQSLQIPIVFPVHPRTKKMLNQFKLQLPKNIIPIEPLGYLEMLNLQMNANTIITDSGGVQKEAYLLGIRCLTLRDETEWTETVKSGWNCLVGTNKDIIVEQFQKFTVPDAHPDLYGDGHSAEKIVDIINLFLSDQ